MITAAAAVMVAVFGAFAISGNRVLEMFGLAMASAVFLDAIVVRMLLLPAVLAAARPDDVGAAALARAAAPAGRDRGRARPEAAAGARAGATRPAHDRRADPRPADRPPARARRRAPAPRTRRRRPTEVAERKRLILRLQEHLAYAVRDLLSIDR